MSHICNCLLLALLATVKTFFFFFLAKHVGNIKCVLTVCQEYLKRAANVVTK